MRIKRWAVLGVLAFGVVGLSYRLCACFDPPVDTSETRSDTPSDPPTPPEPPPPAAPITLSVPAQGIKRVVLRAALADAADVATVAKSRTVDVSGVPSGGAEGYHSPDPNWRETSAAKWGLEFVTAPRGRTLVISTKNEIHFIHHNYTLQSLVLRVPAGVEVIREPRQLTGDGKPDLSPPKPAKDRP